MTRYRIKMPVLTHVECVHCGQLDTAYWSDFGAEQPCVNCDAPPIDLIRSN
jgi:hypothetical protein